MLERSGLMIFGALVLSVSAAVAGAGMEQATKPNPDVAWAANEVHALYDPAKQHALVDVNDKFTLKSHFDGTRHRVRLGVLDGARAIIGTCENAANLKDGERRTTWLDVQYDKVDEAGKTTFTVRRTLDFHNHERVYRFTAVDGARAILEPGVSVSLNNGVLTYEQTTGPIGTSGDTKAMRVSYKLGHGFGDITAAIELDQQAWTVSTSDATASDAPLYSVNKKAIEPYVVGTEGITRDHAVVADPLQGSGVYAKPAATVLKVSGDGTKSVGDLDVTDEDAVAACQSLACYFDFQCTSMGAGCHCHDLDGPTGPWIGICLV